MKSKREINRDALKTEGKNKPSKKKIITRENEYSEQGFSMLVKMQERHFWYRGRHRFLMEAVSRYLPESGQPFSANDLGGGVGGWVRYLAQHRPEGFVPLGLADSSMAASVLPPNVQSYQIDSRHFPPLGEAKLIFLLVAENFAMGFHSSLQPISSPLSH